jgi:hypothetical protein
LQDSGGRVVTDIGDDGYAQDPGGTYRPRARALLRSLAFLDRLDEIVLGRLQATLMSSLRARALRWVLDAVASTPPRSAGIRDEGVDRDAWLSGAPCFFFGLPVSPTFSNECLSGANAVRCAR